MPKCTYYGFDWFRNISLYIWISIDRSLRNVVQLVSMNSSMSVPASFSATCLVTSTPDSNVVMWLSSRLWVLKRQRLLIDWDIGGNGLLGTLGYSNRPSFALVRQAAWANRPPRSAPPASCHPHWTYPEVRSWVWLLCSNSRPRCLWRTACACSGRERVSRG